MRYLGLDLGTKTLGVAITDKENIIAEPLDVIKFQENDYASLIPIVKEIIDAKKITDIALGLPKNMDGTEGFAAQRSKDFAKMLKELKVNIHLVDERLTTISALNILKETNKHNIKAKKVDALAASLILESYLKGNVWKTN